ncbi:MAG TPA: sugar ABC transporter substrate-binding protein [Capillimicrobium sp.]|nr:sugar ABC transporter substrate-binding protein [Capillimicrobium sp.]
MALIAALLAVLALAACGGGDDEGTDTAAGTTEPAQVEGTVRVIMEEVPDTDVVEDMLPAFKKQYPNVDVEIEALPYDQMRDRIVSSFLASKPTYDLIIVDNPWMYDFAEGGFLEPLDDRIDATKGFDFEDYSAPLREIATVDGQVYGVPFYNYALALVYRKDLYDKAGLKPPTTLDELQQAAAKLTTDGRAGIAMQPQTGYKIFEEWANYLFAAGGSIQDDEGNVTLDSPEAREALQKYIDIYQESAPENSLNWAFDESIRAVSSDKAAQLLSYNWMLPTLNREAGDDRFAIAEVPGGKAVLGAWYWSIPANSANPDAAWSFISWLGSPEHERERVIAGGAPVRNSALDDEEVWQKGFGRDYYQTVKAALEDAEPLANGPNAEEMITVVGEELNAAVAGQKSVDQAITDAAKRAQETLDQ